MKTVWIWNLVLKEVQGSLAGSDEGSGALSNLTYYEAREEGWLLPMLCWNKPDKFKFFLIPLVVSQGLDLPRCVRIDETLLDPPLL